MNHERVASMWVAHNVGLATIQTMEMRKGEKLTHNTRVKAEARGSRLSFHGATISSHHWWPFATFEANAAGEKAVIFRNKRYSNSTSQHQSEVRQALRKYAFQVPVFDVEDDINASHGERIKGYMHRIRTGFDLAIKARSRAPQHIEYASLEHEEMLAYSRFFGVKIPPWANPFATPEEMVRMEAKLTELSIKTGVTINSFWRAP